MMSSQKTSPSEQEEENAAKDEEKGRKKEPGECKTCVYNDECCVSSESVMKERGRKRCMQQLCSIEDLTRKDQRGKRKREADQDGEKAEEDEKMKKGEDEAEVLFDHSMR